MQILINLRKNQKNKNLIKLDKIPAILYGKNFKNLKLKINNNNYYYNILKINSIILLKLINIVYKVKIKNIFYHPYKKLIIHIDFLNL